MLNYVVLIGVSGANYTLKVYDDLCEHVWIWRICSIVQSGKLVGLFEKLNADSLQVLVD